MRDPGATQIGGTLRSPNRGSKIERILQPMLEAATRQDCVAAGVALNLPGDQSFEIYAGAADREGSRKLGAGSSFQAGSQAKTYIGAAAALLAKEGLISLDAPVADYLEEAAMLVAESAPTLRQLLHHTSGIGDFSFFLGDETLPWPLPRLDDRDILLLAAAHGAQFIPGTNWQYCNTGYFLLGAILERVSGATMNALVRKRFLEPLGLAGTRLGGESTQPAENMAAGYFHARGPKGPMIVDASSITDMSWARHAGDLITTLRDSLTWMTSLGRADGRIGVTLADLTSGHVDLLDYENRYPTRPRYYGFGVSSPMIAGRRCWGHSGGTFGYASGSFFEPGSAIGISYFMTYVHGDRPEADAVLERHKSSILNAALALALHESHRG